MHVPSEDSSSSSSSQKKQKQQKRVGLDAAAGALSGAISRFLVGPLDVVKIRFQVQLEPIGLETALTKRPPHYHGFLHAFRTIVAEEGIKVRWHVVLPATHTAVRHSYSA
jgi:solute carrier family 25 thiamine pyrophosphate transporter 19